MFTARTIRAQCFKASPFLPCSSKKMGKLEKSILFMAPYHHIPRIAHSPARLAGCPIQTGGSACSLLVFENNGGELPFHPARHRRRRRSIFNYPSPSIPHPPIAARKAHHPLGQAVKILPPCTEMSKTLERESLQPLKSTTVVLLLLPTFAALPVRTSSSTAKRRHVSKCIKPGRVL